MGGASSLRGLAGYQQRYVTVRVLGELGRRALAENAADPVLAEFSIEGQTSDDAPSWDVRFAFSDGNVDLHECKDTAITRSDRLAFYDRLRKEVASGPLRNAFARCGSPTQASSPRTPSSTSGKSLRPSVASTWPE